MISYEFKCSECDSVFCHQEDDVKKINCLNCGGDKLSRTDDVNWKNADKSCGDGCASCSFCD